MKTITILGATGSIGDSTLDVVVRNPDRYRVHALTAHSNIDNCWRSRSGTGLK